MGLDKSTSIRCRKVQVQQSILNLLNNSQDAIENLSEKWIRISVESSPEDVTIAVSDSGKGIPKDIEDRILQPFFSTKTPGKGTGLGLSIVQRVAETHGGSLKRTRCLKYVLSNEISCKSLIKKLEA